MSSKDVSEHDNDITNPKYVGPGTWNVIHRHAFNARTKERQLSFIDLMNEICSGFPCKICSGHCADYIKNNPMHEYLGVTITINGESLPIGMFIWTWKFHNAVNKRLNKPIMDWNTAYNFYSQKDYALCSSTCMASSDE